MKISQRDKMVLMEEDWLRVFLVNEDLRRRNGNLASQLISKDDPDVVPIADLPSRFLRLKAMVETTMAFLEDEASSEDVKDCAREVRDYTKNMHAVRESRKAASDKRWEKRRA